MRPEASGQRPEGGAAGATLIDGVAIAKAVRADVARETAELKARGITPGLTVVIVGEDPASQSYVTSKGSAPPSGSGSASPWATARRACR
jgi:hypothetical protein